MRLCRRAVGAACGRSRNQRENKEDRPTGVLGRRIDRPLDRPIHVPTHPFTHSSLHPHTHPLIHRSIYPSTHPSIHALSIHPSIHPCIIHPSIYTSIPPSTYPSIHLSIHPPIHPFIHPGATTRQSPLPCLLPSFAFVQSPRCSEHRHKPHFRDLSELHPQLAIGVPGAATRRNG